MISQKTIGRLSLYRRMLIELLDEGKENIYSHDLAGKVHGTAAQVRRDMMAIGYSGSPTRGYGIQELIASIGNFLDAPRGQDIALVGIGNLGLAILAYFAGRRPKLRIVAAFDNDPAKTDCAIHDCPCYPIEELQTVLRERRIDVAVVAVPAEEAQRMTHRLCESGVRGIINFAPVRLDTPPGVYVEDIDVTTALEKVAFFARHTEETTIASTQSESGR